MDALVRALRHFLARDVIYVVGGGAVLLSFLYVFGRLPDENLPTAYYWFGAGLAYVIGYAVQDGFSLTGLSTTSPSYRPGRFSRELHRHFQRRRFPDIPESFDPHTVFKELLRTQSEEALRSLQRTINLMHVGTTMGSSAALSGIMLTVNAYVTETKFDIALSVFVIVFGILFVTLSWIKVTELAEAIFNLHKSVTKS